MAYFRVSTDRQGRSGLGLDAKREKVRAFLGEGYPPVAEFTELESGKKADRPELRRAIAEARRRDLPLVVAKIDRLARDVRLFLDVLDQGVDLRFAELPELPTGAAGRFMLQQFAAVAELERGLISERTNAALSAARARGRASVAIAAASKKPAQPWPPRPARSALTPMPRTWLRLCGRPWSPRKPQGGCSLAGGPGVHYPPPPPPPPGGEAGHGRPRPSNES
ncbi:MAG: recombinase family protein [Thalassobaculum sp.]|uniref:recombinase family protein n=1 Tax=Thalassobaculum sp. TaxID=2022740 RepID=UPI0032ED63CA